jgi:hypothetical protein
MKKNLILILLALVALVNLASCGSSSANPSDAVTAGGQTEAPTEAVTTAPETEPLPTHVYLPTGQKDAAYHEVKCSHCDDVKTEAHTYEEGYCPVCATPCPFAFGITPGAGTCTIYGFEEGVEWEHPVLTIPATINGCRVTEIDDRAFLGDYYGSEDEVVEIVLPDTITKIGDNAFANRDTLEKINLPTALTEIGNDAFSFCEALTNVVLPAGLTTIGDKAFNSCVNLTGIAFPEGLTTIGESAFGFCEALTEIRLPASITAIGERAFSGCKAVTELTYAGTLEEWNALGLGEEIDLFYGTVTLELSCSDGVKLFNYAYEVHENGTTCTLTGIHQTEDVMVIPAVINGYTVTEIGDGVSSLFLWFGASNNGEHIRELVLPEGVTVIHEKAFEDFFLLETITIPSSVTAIEADAFANAAPSRILYGGTMEQWHDIVLGDDWFKESILVAYPVIHCTNGEIILPSRWNR